MTSHDSAPTVSAAWLAEHLDDDGLVVVDSTTHLALPANGPYTLESGRSTYEAEHIPGAVFADLLTDFADTEASGAWTVPPSEKFAASAAKLGIGDGRRVVLYDQSSGFWATRLWWHLRLEGFDNAAVLDGGLRAWTASGRPVTDAPSTVPPAEFTPARRPGLLRSKEEVAAAVDDERTVLVNVLDPETYRGERTTYSRPGHIPGSINLPVTEITDPSTGLLKPVEELRVIFDRAGLLDPGVAPVTYCGGGIAATGVAHALALVGRDDVAVYDGSLTEWSADSSLPLVTGSSPR
ncbi:sulfurtransferase [Nocardiopsis ansamitocini]|uniref:Sulfurtransferase n=1 Tax=Nocardiopsis ansamitocini TaxID=1670832 RepID=A0A9W6P946_9ACTN|nr:sulfurtransferase [Nocardiopsis ansamitocini]GLU49440.1 sulfurtransferase [Nocardiopsis ansamitocini]